MLQTFGNSFWVISLEILCHFGRRQIPLSPDNLEIEMFRASLRQPERSRAPPNSHLSIACWAKPPSGKVCKPTFRWQTGRSDWHKPSCCRAAHLKISVKNNLDRHNCVSSKVTKVIYKYKMYIKYRNILYFKFFISTPQVWVYQISIHSILFDSLCTRLSHHPSIHSLLPSIICTWTVSKRSAVAEDME